MRRYVGRLELACGTLTLALFAVAVLLAIANGREHQHERAVIERIEPCLADLHALQDASAMLATSWVLAVAVDDAAARADYARHRRTLEGQVVALDQRAGKSVRGQAIANIAARARALAAIGDASIANASAGASSSAPPQAAEAAVQAFVAFHAAITEVSDALRSDIADARADADRVDELTRALAIAGLAAGAIAVALLVRVSVLRRRSLWATELERARLAALMQATGVGVLELDATTAVRFANPAAAAALASTPAELAGTPIRALLPPPFDVPDPLLEGIARAQRWAGDTTFIARNASELPARMRSSPLPGGGAVLIFEGLGDERVREGFLVLASHELRGPLTSVLGFARMLARRLQSQQPLLEAETREAIEVIAQQAERMQHAVSLFLDVARLETGTIELEVEPLSLQGIMRTEIAALCQRYTSVTVTQVYPEDSAIVESDEQRLRQVIGNLLDNAAKYADPAQPAITVTLARAADGGVEVRVRDNGAGIRPDVEPYIFQRFYRSEQPKARGEGLGLGLYISRRIARHLGAELSFTPNPGSGAEFSLRLPPTVPAVQPIGLAASTDVPGG